MTAVLSVLQTVLPVLLALGLGVLCRKKQLLSRSGVDALKTVAVNIALPAVLLDAFATARYDSASLLVPAIMFAVCCLALWIGMAVCKLLKLGRLPAFLATGFEAGMLGYALFALLFPEEPTSSFAIVDLGQVLFVFTVYKAMLYDKGDRRAVVKDIVSSPIIWAIAAGVLIGATGLYGLMDRTGVSGVFQSLTSFISAPTGMIILLVVGYDLDLAKIRWKDTAGFIALRLVTMGVLLLAVLGLNRYVLGGLLHTGALTLMFLLPPPYVLPVFSKEESQRAAISGALSALTLVTMLLFAVMAAVL